MYKKILLLSISLLGLSLTGASCFSRESADGGILRSLDGARTFEFKNVIDEKRTLALTSVNTVFINPDIPDQVLIGTNGAGYFVTQDQGESWKSVAFSEGDARAIAADPKDTNTLYLVVDNKIYRTKDNGVNFETIFVDQSGVIRDIHLDPINSKRVYALSSTGSFMTSSDGGDHWQAKALIDATTRRFSIDPVDPQKIYLTTVENGLYISKDAGANFSNSAFSLDTDQFGEANNTFDVAINPQNHNQVFVGTAHGLFRSDNAGEDWSFIQTLVVPNGPWLRTVTFHPSIANTLLFSSSNKLYISSDLGVSWSVVEIPTTREVTDIAFAPSDPNEVYLAIGGSGTTKQPIDIIKFGQ